MSPPIQMYFVSPSFLNDFFPTLNSDTSIGLLGLFFPVCFYLSSDSTFSLTLFL